MQSGGRNVAYSDMALVGNCIRSGRYWFKECGFFVFGYLMKIKKDEIIGLETG